MKFLRKKNLYLIALILLLSLSIGISTSIVNSKNENNTTYECLELFSKSLNLIKNNYVDSTKLEDEKLIYGAIEGLIKKLDDPYSRFMDPEEYKEMKVETSGSFGGLGIVIGIKDEKLTVISPIEDTPAYKIGIKAGDIITLIEDKNTKGITLSEAVRMLRGPKGSKVTMTIQREGEKDLLNFTIIRDIIKIDSAKSDLIQEKVGYLRIITFNQNTPFELDREISKLKEHQDLVGMILDLRNNPGGLLNSAVEVSNRFIKQGLIVFTKGRNPQDSSQYFSDRSKTTVNLPLIVLINEGSASGSEIVTGAIQDSKRGIILGKKSFGKGCVQTIFPLPHNAAVALTTAMYYTPSGRSIHDKGIIPDKEVEYSNYSKEDLSLLLKAREGEFIKKFVKNHNQSEVEILSNELAKNKINLSQEIILKEIKKEKHYLSRGKKPIYDLDIDQQLKVAVEMLISK
ncbi:S41 family peptidase [bacterium]|nr:S41 family peptidase [bacterium]MBU1152919.1 S41 family peptidase [bacterium]MBU2599967.1 S41 family peptidase [bacterium]